MYATMYAVMLYGVILSINVFMLEVSSICVVCSPPAREISKLIYSEPSWPGPAQVAGITPVYLGAVEPYTTVWHHEYFLLNRSKED